MATKKQLAAGLDIAFAAAEFIRTSQSQEVPEGHLYAHLMGVLDLGTFEKLVQCLVRTGLVRKERNLLRWVGPEIA